jgi:hypothetical protein
VSERKEEEREEERERDRARESQTETGQHKATEIQQLKESSDHHQWQKNRY